VTDYFIINATKCYQEIIYMEVLLLLFMENIIVLIALIAKIVINYYLCLLLITLMTLSQLKASEYAMIAGNITLM
jgi:hypothetical protein